MTTGLTRVARSAGTRHAIAPTVPSARLTPALRAQEKLGWRLGIEAYTFHRYTLFEAIEKTARVGLPFMGGLSFQKVSDRIPKNLEPGLTDDEQRELRLKLDDAGVRMLMVDEAVRA